MAGLAVLAMALLGESRSYWLLCSHDSRIHSTETGSLSTSLGGPCNERRVVTQHKWVLGLAAASYPEVHHWLAATHQACQDLRWRTAKVTRHLGQAPPARHENICVGDDRIQVRQPLRTKWVVLKGQCLRVRRAVRENVAHDEAVSAVSDREAAPLPHCSVIDHGVCSAGVNSEKGERFAPLQRHASLAFKTVTVSTAWTDYCAHQAPQKLALRP